MGWDEQARTPLLNEPQQQQQQQGRKSESRGCNDIIFAILFVACCVGMVVVSSIGFSKGDPKNLVPYNLNDEIPLQGYFTNAVAQVKENKGNWFTRIS